MGHLKIRKSPQKVRKVLISLGKLIKCARIHIWVDKIAHFSEKHDFSPFFLYISIGNIGLKKKGPVRARHHSGEILPGFFLIPIYISFILWQFRSVHSIGLRDSITEPGLLKRF